MIYIINQFEFEKIKMSGVGNPYLKIAPTFWKITPRRYRLSGLVSKGLTLPETPGVIHTLEGPKKFKFITCLGPGGEFWPMSLRSFLESKNIDLALPNADGWFSSHNKKNTIAWAIQMKTDFVVTYGHSTPLSQKAGGYLLFRGNYCWALAEHLFPLYYAPIKQNPAK